MPISVTHAEWVSVDTIASVDSSSGKVSALAWCDRPAGNRSNPPIVTFTSRLGLAALLLLVSLPFLVPLHTAPIPSFHAEWITVALGLLAGAALLGARRTPLPGAALLALALAGIALVQAALGRAPLPPITSLLVLNLLWAALLACTGSYLAGVFGQARLSRLLASSVLLGAVLAALAGLLHEWLRTPGWIVFSLPSGSTLGQINHLTSYLWLGLASALYLRRTAALPALPFWAAAALLVFSAVLVGQRSSFLYAAALIGIAFWQHRAAPEDGTRRNLRLALGIGLLFLALQPLVMLLPGSTGQDAKPPPATRAVQSIGGPSLRLQLWELGIAGIATAPLLGHGVGSHPGLSLALADKLTPGDSPGPAEHAHNLFIDLGVELGLPAALLVLLGVVLWLRRLPQRCAPAEAAWAAAMLGIPCLHSMIEYPLWYTYFLGLLAVMAGTYGARREVGQRLAPVVLTLGLLLWGGWTLVEIRQDYAKLETSLALGRQPWSMPLARTTLLSISSQSLLAPWVDTTACVSLDPLQVGVSDGLTVCRIAMNFAPCVICAVHTTLLTWRAGDPATARELLRRLRRAQRSPGNIDALLAPFAARDAGLNELIKSRP